MSLQIINNLLPVMLYVIRKEDPTGDTRPRNRRRISARSLRVAWPFDAQRIYIFYVLPLIMPGPNESAEVS